MASTVAARRLVLALAGLALALLAQHTLTSLRPTDGYLLYLAAAALFIAACGPAARSSTVSASANDTLAPETAPRAFRILLVVAGVLTLLALAAFFFARDDWGWAFHLASLVALLIAVWFGCARSPSSIVSRPSSAITPQLPSSVFGLPSPSIVGRRSSVVVLALILAFALAIRLWHNDAIPPGLWFDEAREGIVARQILADPAFRPVYSDVIERPAQHAYLIALSFAALGDSISSLRLVPAVFGALNVLSAYLLFGRWFGRRAGLFAAALWAVLRYDLTFSRIVFDADTTPFFIILTLYWLDRALPRRDLAFYSLAGLTLGLGLAFYLPVRLFAALLGLCALLYVARKVIRARSLVPVRALLPAALCFALGLAIAIGPVAEYALRYPDSFFNRNATASILYERADPDLPSAIFTSTLKHLGMFNVAGDQNGRHNLPGLPMLDPISGALFLLGAALALRRARDPRNLLMLALFAVLLQAGILSTDFEAPQALRSIGVLPAVVYAILLALNALHERLSAALSARTAQRLSLVSVIVLLIVIGAINLDTYFNHQATDPLVWKAHSPGETWAAAEMQRLAPGHLVILTQKYADSATIHYLAPAVPIAQIWSGSEPLPRGRPFVLFVDSSLLPALDSARAAYPQAVLRELRPPSGGEPLAYELIVN